MAGELYFSGITGNFDWGSVLDRIMAVKQIPIQKLDLEKKVISQKLNAVDKFYSKLSEFKNLIENFNLDEALNFKKVNVSDENVVSVNVSNEAPEISFSVEVLNLAQKEILVYDTGFNSLDEQIGTSGSFTLRYYTDYTNYVEYTIDYSSTDTLEDIVRKINEAQDYVKASIYYDGSKYKLMLSETDEANSSVETALDLSTKAIHLLGTLPYQFGSNVLIQQAQNARIKIGQGNPIEDPSNIFENVINGITLTAKTPGTVTINVEKSYGKIENFLKNFTEKFNEIVNNVKDLTLGENAPFRGDNSIMGVKYQLANALNPLIELGIIEYNEDGTIAVSSNLTQIIEENPDEFKTKFNEFLNTTKTFLNIQEESLKDYKEFLQEKSDRISERIKVLTQRLKTEEEILKKQFSQLEAFMNYANDIRERLKQFIVSLSEMTGGNNR